MNIEQRTFAVLIPTSEHSPIAPGSGIVAEIEERRVNIRYEGNLYAAVNAHEAEERLCIAASRLATNYPTVARATVTLEHFSHHYIVAGTYDYPARRLDINPSQRAAWENWCAKYSPAGA